MAIPHLSDNLVNGIVVTWENRPNLFLTKVQADDVSDPRLRRIVRGFLTVGTWDDVFFMADGVAKRESRSMDLRAFQYPLQHSDDAELVFDGVNICDGAFEYINLSEPAFNRLIVGLFDALITGAQEHNLPILQDAQWGVFIDMAASIRKRAQG